MPTFVAVKPLAKEATGFTKEHILVINACKIAITKLAPTIIGHTDNCLFFSNIKSRAGFIGITFSVVATLY